jgi:VWFA-related protein
VQVEVVVTDHRHHPLTGLPEEAFHLEEDGRRQPLVSFEAVDLPESTAPESAAWGPPRVSTNAVDARSTPGRSFVVVFDDLHLGPAGAAKARAVSEQLITQHTRPGDLVTLVVPGEGLVRSAAMPGGRDPLAAATRSLRGRREATSVLEEERRRRRQVLSALAAALEVVPGTGTRTSVLLVSEGFLYEPGDGLSYDVIAASQRAGAVVHFLDVRARNRSSPALRGESTGAEILATITGGSVVRNLSDVAQTLGRLCREASHHYVLAYRPPGERRNGRLRKIHVGVDRPGVVVRARRGYYEAPDRPRGPDDSTSTLDDPLRDALAAPSLIREIPLRVTALAGAPAEGGHVRVTFGSETSAGELKFARLPDGSPVARLDVVLEIRHAQPQASQVAVLERLALRLPRGAPVEDAWLPFQRSFTLPPGRCQVKLVVRDRGSGAIGTVVHHLEVPDATPLRISSPILSDLPEGEGVTPPRIVARRRFAAGSILYCYFEVYPEPGGSAQAPVGAGTAYEIVDRRGKVRHRGGLPPPVGRDGGGVARLVEIPLTRIGPGDYELVLDLAGEVAGGPSELREPFSVTRPPRFNDDLYRGALGAYLEGDFQGAVTTLLPWPAKDLLAAAERLPRTDGGLRETALLLHTDLALLLWRHAHEDAAENHLTIARALVEAAPLPDLHREWLLALASSYQAISSPAEALAFYTECVEAFPEAGEAMLGAGTLHEAIAFLPDGFPHGNLNVRPRRAAKEAERWYREALHVQPSLTEARLRLARVLQRTDRAQEAVPELSRVVETSRDPTLTALAHLFWGEICEAEDGVDEAIAHYRAALAADGDLQVAALALAQALHRREGRRAAFDALVPALGHGAGGSPLLAYRRGPQSLVASPLRSMRSRLLAEAGGQP